MIPEFGLGGVLPPFLSDDVVGAFAPRSPYMARMSDVVARFCTSPERAEILKGLIEFRSSLREVGFSLGFQWLDGSFVEACETTKGRAPNDIDVVSLLQRPNNCSDFEAWVNFVEQHGATLLDQRHCKDNFHCDAYFIDLDISPIDVSLQTAYWFGLFSHQRTSFRWKGLVQVAIECDDEVAGEEIARIEAAW